jgi:ribose transport system permease protein
VSAPTHGLESLMQPQPAHPALVVAPGVLIMAALGLLAALGMKFTVLGRHLLAVGGNEAAARIGGVPVSRARVTSYVICGVMCGVAAVLQFGRLRLGDPTVNVGLELEAIAAVVIGGASLGGGTGSILGTVLGAVMMAYLRNRCAALGWSNFVQDMIVGHIIIAAVAIDTLRRRGGSA